MLGEVGAQVRTMSTYIIICMYSVDSLLILLVMYKSMHPLTEPTGVKDPLLRTGLEMIPMLCWLWNVCTYIHSTEYMLGM